MDEKLLDAISNLFCSPFNPAPILENLRMELNIFNISYFEHVIQKDIADSRTTLLFEPKPLAKKLLRGCLDFFNENVVRKSKQQSKLAIHF